MTPLYLNEPDWGENDGGELECFVSEHGGGLEVDKKIVRPLGGTIVLFDSRKIKHQVLAARRDRYAMTQWFVSSDLLFDSKPPIGARLVPVAGRSAKPSSSTKPCVSKVHANWSLDLKTDVDKAFSFGFS